MKDGYKTTEFWISLLGQILPLLVLLGVISIEQAEGVFEAGSNLILAVFGVLGLLGIVPSAVYVYGRTQLKKAAIEAKG